MNARQGKFDTALTQMLGIDVPIVQAPIGELARAELAAAVSNAGGLGMLALTWARVSRVASAIDRVRQLTDRPFGVNLGLAWPQEERLRIVLEKKVPVVSFFWGTAEPFVGECHAAGAVVMQTVGSAAEARAALNAGVDIVVAQGWEAGGHVWGSVASLPLIPAVVDAASGAPVVAAGGIADGRGMAAALALGASGVWLGTRFVMASETAAHATYRQALAKADEAGTVYSTVFDGGWPDAPHRTLRNSTTTAWESHGRPPAGRRPGEGDVIATHEDGSPVMRYESASPARELTGDVEAASLWAGQSVGLISDVASAQDIVRRLVDECRLAIRSAGRMTGMVEPA